MSHDIVLHYTLGLMQQEKGRKTIWSNADFVHDVCNLEHSLALYAPHLQRKFPSPMRVINPHFVENPAHNFFRFHEHPDIFDDDFVQHSKPGLERLSSKRSIMGRKAKKLASVLDQPPATIEDCLVQAACSVELLSAKLTMAAMKAPADFSKLPPLRQREISSAVKSFVALELLELPVIRPWEEASYKLMLFAHYLYTCFGEETSAKIAETYTSRFGKTVDDVVALEPHLVVATKSKNSAVVSAHKRKKKTAEDMFPEGVSRAWVSKTTFKP